MISKSPETSAVKTSTADIEKCAASSLLRLAYIRVSADDQNPRLQEEMIKAYGVDRVFKDVESGDVTTRADYLQLIKEIEVPDDRETEVVVYRLDRLGRHPVEMITFFDRLETYQVRFISLTEPWLTDWNKGPMQYLMWWQQIGMARFELLLLKDRQRRGLDAKMDAVRQGKDSWNGRGKDKKQRRGRK